MRITRIREVSETSYLDFQQLKLSPKQQLVLLFTNQSQISGFSKKINNCITNHFDKLAQHPQVHLRKETFKSIFKGDFSVSVLIAHDFEEIVEAAQMLDKKAEECQYG